MVHRLRACMPRLLERAHFTFSSQCLPHANWPSTGLPAQELRRGGSARKSKGRSGQDAERTARGLIPEHPGGELVPAAYSEPYSAINSWHRPTAPPSHPELSNVRGCGVWGLPSCLGWV